MIDSLFKATSGTLGLWNEWTKTRPSVSVASDKLFGVGERYLHFVIKNPTKHQIWITYISVKPDLFEVWKDDDAKSAMDAYFNRPVSAFIDPEDEARFPICLHAGISEENKLSLCSIDVRWRSMRYENIPCFPVIYRTRVGTLETQQKRP